MDPGPGGGSPAHRAGTGHRFRGLQPSGKPEGNYRRVHPRFAGENFSKDLTRVKAFKELAAEKGVAPSQLALAWVLAKGEDLVPIPGTAHRDHLQDNLAALRVELGSADLTRLDDAFPPGATAGERYAAQAMAHLNG